MDRYIELITEDKEILKLTIEGGWTVAHEQAKRGWTTEDKEILKLADKHGWSVAHEQARNGWKTEDKEILKLATKDGWTVAHEQAKHGWITEDEEILKLADEKGYTVYETIFSYWNEVAQDPKKRSLFDENFNTLLSIIAKEKELVKEKNLKDKNEFLFKYKNTKSEGLFKQIIKQRLENFTKKIKR